MPAQLSRDSTASQKRLSVLRLVLNIGETSAPYNQFSLPMSARQDITLCSYFKSGISPPSELRYLESDGTRKGFLRTLNTALAERHYDVVHCHTPHVAFFYLLASRGSLCRRLPPSVLTIHCSYENLKLRNRLMLLPSFFRFDKIIYCSASAWTSFPRWLQRICGKRAEVIPNGVDIPRIERALGEYTTTGHAPSSAERCFTVGSVGRLISLKHPMTIAEAFAESSTSNDKLVFIGDGPLKEPLQAFGDRVSGEICVEGVLPRDTVFRTLSSLDVFVSASDREGMPVAVLEAMACRVPVILSDIPPHRELASDCDFIPLVKVGDVKGLSRQISRFRKMAASDRRAVGEQCRRLAETRFSLRELHERYEKTFRSLTSVRSNSQNPSRRAA